MKFSLTFKTPDVLYDALQDISEDDRDRAQEVANKFVTYGEYVTIDIDTEKETAEVQRK